MAKDAIIIILIALITTTPIDEPKCSSMVIWSKANGLACVEFPVWINE